MDQFSSFYVTQGTADFLLELEHVLVRGHREESWRLSREPLEHMAREARRRVPRRERPRARPHQQPKLRPVR